MNEYINGHTYTWIRTGGGELNGPTYSWIRRGGGEKKEGKPHAIKAWGPISNFDNESWLKKNELSKMIRQIEMTQT